MSSAEWLESGAGLGMPWLERRRRASGAALAPCSVTPFLWLGCCAVCAWTFAYIVYRAIQAYPLDAFEEFELLKATRWAQGFPLYADPAAEAFPTAYPPLHYWMLAAWTGCFGASLLAARALSGLAMLGVVAVGFWELRDAAYPARARLLFLTLLLAFDSFVGKWFELCKSDALLALFLSIAIATGRQRSWGEAAGSTLAIVLAALTKQNAPLFIAPIAVALGLAGRWRWAAAWAIGTALAVSLVYAALGWSSGGNFFDWVFVWTSRHGFSLASGLRRAFAVTATRAPLTVGVLAGGAILRARCRWTWCLAAAWVVGVLGMAKRGGLENHLLPAAVITALVAARGLAWGWSAARDGGTARERDRPCGRGISGRLLRIRSACAGIVGSLLASRRARRGFVLAVLGALVWPGLPRVRDFRWVVRRADEADQWVQAVRRFGGRIAVGHHALLAHRAGAECFFSDLILEFPALRVADSVAARIAAEEMDYLLLEADPARSRTPGWPRLVLAHYTPAGELDTPNRSGLLPRRLYMARRLLAGTK